MSIEGAHVMKLQSRNSFLGGVAIIGLSCGCLTLGCNAARQALSDTRATDEATIRRLDADWVKAGQSKQVDAWMAFYTGDAVVLPPNEVVATSKDSIRKTVGELLGLPGLSLQWEPTKVEVARSGDIAYLYGAYELTMDGPNGKPLADRGKNIEIWKKQPDGSWRCAVDTWNSDMPATLSADMPATSSSNLPATLGSDLPADQPSN
jgi:ketosteroid isomerase-like protein